MIILLFIIFLLGISLLFLISERHHFPYSFPTPQEKNFISKKFLEIEKQASSENESEYKGAIVEAEKILMWCLEKLGYKGTAKEKLKQSEHHFSSPHNLFKAHLLRNKIVHEVNFSCSPEKARWATREYKRALKDLGVLK